MILRNVPSWGILWKSHIVTLFHCWLKSSSFQVIPLTKSILLYAAKSIFLHRKFVSVPTLDFSHFWLEYRCVWADFLTQGVNIQMDRGKMKKSRQLCVIMTQFFCYSSVRNIFDKNADKKLERFPDVSLQIWKKISELPGWLVFRVRSLLENASPISKVELCVDSVDAAKWGGLHFRNLHYPQSKLWHDWIARPSYQTQDRLKIRIKTSSRSFRYWSLSGSKASWKK